MPMAPCSRCSTPVLYRGAGSKSGRIYCADDPECQKERNRLRMRSFNAARPGYYAKYSKATHEKHQAERKAGTRSSKRRTHPEMYRAADQRRRARKAGATTEQFSSKEIFERDRWMCGICGHTVDSKLRYPHPRSASLDHVVALSKGGAHTRANCRCSHLECNVRRGAD